MAWTASLPSVVTGNPTKASDYNNLLNNVLFRRDTATGDTTQLVVAVGSDGSAATPAIKRNADATGFYFAAGAVNVSCAGTQSANFTSAGSTFYSPGTSPYFGFAALIAGAAAPSGAVNAGIWIGVGTLSSGTGNWASLYIAPLSNVSNLGTAPNGNGIYLAASTIATGTVSLMGAGALSSSTAYGINFAGITTTGAGNAAYGINISSVTVSTGGGNCYGVYVGSVSVPATSGSAFAFYHAQIIPVANNVSTFGFYSAGASFANGGVAFTSFYAGTMAFGSAVTATGYGFYSAGASGTSTTSNFYALYLATQANSGNQYSIFFGSGYAVSPTLTNTQTIKTAAAAGSQAGWIVINVNGTKAYFPYWTAT